MGSVSTFQFVLRANPPVAWRIPIMAMQVYPVLLLAVIYRLPETPRWLVFHDRQDDAYAAIADIDGEDEAKGKLDELNKANEEESSQSVGYSDMLLPHGNSFHPTVVTIMGQVNQALTGYGAVSVYGPQIFELLGFGVSEAEYLTLGNYISYFFLMTFAWLLIDRVGRRPLMIAGAGALAISFLILTLLGGLASNCDKLGIPNLAVSIPGSVCLYIATGMFGIGWLSQVWLIPTEIFPSTSRAQGSAVSVIIWGLANFAVTLLTPIGFNNLRYWLFLIFAVTNLFAMWWTWVNALPHESMNVANGGLYSNTAPKPVAARLKRTSSSSRKPKSVDRGPSTRSRRASTSTCPEARKRMERRRRYLAMGLEAPRVYMHCYSVAPLDSQASHTYIHPPNIKSHFFPSDLYIYERDIPYPKLAYTLRDRKQKHSHPRLKLLPQTHPPPHV